MIGKLTGRLDSTGEDWALIDVSGVGYLVFCSNRTLGQLGNSGETTTGSTGSVGSADSLSLNACAPLLPPDEAQGCHL